MFLFSVRGVLDGEEEIDSPRPRAGISAPVLSLKVLFAIVTDWYLDVVVMGRRNSCPSQDKDRASRLCVSLAPAKRDDSLAMVTKLGLSQQTTRQVTNQQCQDAEKHEDLEILEEEIGGSSGGTARGAPGRPFHVGIWPRVRLNGLHRERGRRSGTSMLRCIICRGQQPLENVNIGTIG